MTKTKVLYIALAALVILNLALMGFTFFGKKGKQNGSKGKNSPKNGPKEIVVDKLNFDDAQVALYNEEILKHRESVKALESQIREGKKNLYASLSDEMLTKDSLISVISSVQAEIESVHYEHFLAIKAICKADQLDNFEALSKELARVFAPHRRSKH